MIRTSARLTTLLAATALLGGAMAVNCSKGTDNAGVVRLALQIPPGYTINTVHWQIMSATNTEIKHGDINTSDINSTASVDTSCPAGTGMTVVMSATANITGGGTVSCTGTSNTFNLSANGSAMPGLTLICGGGQAPQTMGDVIVKANVVAGDYCPLLTQWEASPLQTTSGQNISVSVTATDSDTPVLTYAWTTSSGSFGNPAAAVTNYVCGAPGDQTVTILVSDGTAACNKSVTFMVHCVAAGICGNGMVEPGEQCDPPSPGGVGNCSATCQHQIFCGDSIKEGPEQCDPPSVANHCSATCTTIAFCGDGVITPPETCEPPGGTNPDGTTCSATCTKVVTCTSNACITCEMSDPADCPASLNIVPGGTGCYGCEGFGPGTALRTHCQALYTCVRTTGCMNADDTTPCLCGTLTPANCAASGPPATAACAAQYAAAAADTPALGPVVNQTSNPTSAVGIANNQAVCAVDSAVARGCVCP